MSYELNVYVNDYVRRVFIQKPLMDCKSMTGIIHSHKYAEIHIIFGGEAEILVGTEKHNYSSGSVYVIPGDVYHCYLKSETDTKIVAFQTDIKFGGFVKRLIPESIVSELIRIITEEKNYLSNSCFSALLSYVCSVFFFPFPMNQTDDPAAVIYEFISNNYNRNVKISELADNLHLSEKQTERLVKKHTGFTFKTAVVNYRMMVAKFLEENSNMSEAEIACYIGYMNYSGYWKAKQKFVCNQQKTSEI